MNTLYYGDNLDVLKRYLKDETIDLVYLDPPFNSNRDYNVLFAEQDGSRSASQIKAFGDTWKWDQASASAFEDVVMRGDKVSDVMSAFRTFLGANDMLAYLAMMAPRLIELRRVLKPTGSIYLHCDPTASHYLKLLMDAVFGIANFRNEIIWKRSNPKSNVKINLPTCTDTVLRYSKTQNCIYNQLFEEHDPEYVKTAYRYNDAQGRYRLLPLLNPNDNRPNLTYEFLGVTRVWRWSKERMQKALKDGVVVQTKPGAVPQYKKYLSDSKGRTITNCWVDIQQAAGNESLDYPTQKPIALLERILQISSNPGDVVLDPFCGCGTSIEAAEQLERKWIGIDITHLAITLIKSRLADAFPSATAPNYKIIGEPTDLAGALQLAQDDPYQFRWWALGLLGARPVEQKKGADAGIDGKIVFMDDNSGKTKRLVFSVKAGKNLHVNFVRDLRGVLDREKDAVMGILITAYEPTKPMTVEAASSEYYQSDSEGDGRWKKFPRIQIRTIEQLLAGKGIERPAGRSMEKTFKRAPEHQKKDKEHQGKLFKG